MAPRDRPGGCEQRRGRRPAFVRATLAAARPGPPGGRERAGPWSDQLVHNAGSDLSHCSTMPSRTRTRSQRRPAQRGGHGWISGDGLLVVRGLQVHGVAEGLVHRVHEHPGSRQARTGSASTAPSARRRSSRREPSDGCHAACSQADHTASCSDARPPYTARAPAGQATDPPQPTPTRRQASPARLAADDVANNQSANGLVRPRTERHHRQPRRYPDTRPVCASPLNVETSALRR
jgi:hypothetical protein